MQRTLRTALRFLLPLTVLVAAPLLGGGGRALAGYITLASLSERPNADSFDGAPYANVDDMGTASAADETVQQTDFHDPQALHPSLFGSQLAELDFGGSWSSGGAGCPSPSGAAGPEYTGQPPALTARPPTDAPALVGVMFLETASRRPPPFPARLFRPPRLS